MKTVSIIEIARELTNVVNNECPFYNDGERAKIAEYKNACGFSRFRIAFGFDWFGYLSFINMDGGTWTVNGMRGGVGYCASFDDLRNALTYAVRKYFGKSVQDIKTMIH